MDNDINDRIYDDKYDIQNKNYENKNLKKYGYDNEYIEHKNKPFDIKETYKKLSKNGTEDHRSFLEKSRSSTHIIGLGREEKIRYDDNQRYLCICIYVPCVFIYIYVYMYMYIYVYVCNTYMCCHGYV
jgi:hypothetical protein